MKVDRYWLLVLLALLVLADLTLAATRIQSLDGKTIDLESVAAKSPVVLNFWATWCGPCRLELPHLQKVYEEYGAKGIVFVAISLDNPRNKKMISDFLTKNKVSLPVYIDTSGEVAKKFKITAIPTTFLLGRGGEVIYQVRGYRPGDEIVLRKQIENMLQKQEARKN